MAQRWRRRLFYAVLPILVGLNAWQLRIETDLSAFMIAGQSTEELLLASEMRSGALSRRYILSVGQHAARKVDFSVFVEKFVQQLRTTDGIISVWRADRQAETFETVASFYAPHAHQLYSLNPERDTKQLFLESALDQRAKLLKNAILSPQGRLVKKIAVADPLLLTLNAIRHQGRRLLNPQSEVNNHYINLIVETEPSGVDAPAQRLIQDGIRNIFEKAKTLVDDSSTLEMTGVPVFAVKTHAILAGDIQRISVISSIALIVLFFWIFRSLYALLWVSLVLATAVSAAILITNVVFGYVHGLTIAVGTSLIGICIDYPIHALVHTSEVTQKKRQGIIRAIWPTLLLGGVTTLIGYSALGFSGYPGFQQIAVYAGSGIGLALLITRYVLVALTEGKTYQWTPKRFVTKWLIWSTRYRRVLMVCISALLLVTLSGLTQLQWIVDLEQLTPELKELKEQDKLIRSRMISVEPGRFILLRADDLESALVKSEQLYQILEELRNDGVLDDYFGLYPWILSQKLQKRNQTALAHQLTDQNVQMWRKALVDNGLSVERLGNLMLQDVKPLTLEDVKKTAAWRMIESQVVFGEQNVLLIIGLAKHSPELVVSALSQISGVQYFSQRDVLNRMSQDYQQRAVTMLSAGLTVIFLLLLWRYRHPRRAVLALLPALVAALFILSGWSLAGQSLSFLHLVGFLLSVAICVDYGIFFLENPTGDCSMTYQAIMASMLTSSVAFGCMGLAESSMLQILSATVASGVVIGFLACPIFIGSSDDTLTLDA